MEIYKNLMYVETPLDQQDSLNERLFVEDKTYYRYMDRIYIPDVPADLCKEDVAALSEIRIKLNGEVIDYSYTKELISCLISEIDTKGVKQIIDFGCGGGILAEVLIEQNSLPFLQNIIGVDISAFAVKAAALKYESLGDIESSTFQFDGSEKLPLEDNSIDAIVSSFVMHFRMYDNQLEELYRVLKEGCSFVYNDYVYSKYAGHFKNILGKLEKIGFDVKEETMSFVHPDTKTIKYHKVVRAVKPKTCQ